MTQQTKDMQLASRAQQFAALLAGCEITDKDGASSGIEPGMNAALQMLAKVRGNGGSVYVIGNGGSAAVASHAVIDLVNVAKLRAFTLHEPSVLTCIVNDYGLVEVGHQFILHNLSDRFGAGYGGLAT